MQLNKDERKEVEKRIHRSASFQKVFCGDDGEFVLKEIDEFTGYGDDAFNPDPYKNAYNSGQRSMAKFLHNIIDSNIEKARKLLGESDEK